MTEQRPPRIVGPLVIGLLGGLIGPWIALYVSAALLDAIGFIDSLAMWLLGHAIAGLAIGALLARWPALVGVLAGISPGALFIMAMDVRLYDRSEAYLEAVVTYTTTACGFAGGWLGRKAWIARSWRSIASAAATGVAALVLALAPSLVPGAISVGQLGWSEISNPPLGYTLGKPPDFNYSGGPDGRITFRGIDHQIGIATFVTQGAGTLDSWQREQLDFNERLNWGTPDSVEEIEVAGRPAVLLTYNHDRGDFAAADFGVVDEYDVNAAPPPREWVGDEAFTLQTAVVDGGRIFVITSVSVPGDEASDRQLFFDVLSTFRLDADGT